ncbi:hypothetical protein BDV28DRAFT_9110 [Aspergillus coremiiformis]|uniref:Uncharacterized protein n=1 Tax=Aspergillus coremiiformis TaxID=138285 RepID=A0A5N6Z2T8_9EURO|nr:hypothetical protein BDV28DRAFT_9110 [Aspergillus coremiiformis]
MIYLRAAYGILVLIRIPMLFLTLVQWTHKLRLQFPPGCFLEEAPRSRAHSSLARPSILVFVRRGVMVRRPDNVIHWCFPSRRVPI